MTPEQLVLSDLRAHYPEMSEAELLKIMEEWELHPFMQQGQLTGVGMTKGSEFHFLSAPGMKLSRKEMRAGLEPLFDRFGFLTTRVALDDEANKRFNHLFGFQATWADDRFQYYMMTALPFSERKQTCQQSQ